MWKMAPYLVALALERSGCDWAKGKVWTEYLFSTGTNGHSAQQENDTMVRKILADQDAIAVQNVQEEMAYRACEDKRVLSRRLLVTNIAADGRERELMTAFGTYRLEM